MAVKKNNKEIGRSNRAGISLARAQRLSESAQSGSGSGVTLRLLATLLLCGAAVMVYFVAADAPESDVAAAITRTNQALTAEAAPETATAEPDETAAIEVAEQPIDEAPVAEPLDPKPEVVAAVERQAAPVRYQSACIAAIEAQLDVLAAKSEGAEASAWTDKEEEIGTLMQYVLDCPDAGIEINGNVELVAKDIADLFIRWDRFGRSLKLNTVPPTPWEAEDIIINDTRYVLNAPAGTQWIQFLIR